MDAGFTTRKGKRLVYVTFKYTILDEKLIAAQLVGQFGAESRNLPQSNQRLVRIYRKHYWRSCLLVGQHVPLHEEELLLHTTRCSLSR
jgi:hypothetical protein